jgi:Lanthionine synthetase C-like protein
VNEDWPVLFSPESHEPLVDRAWDEPWARQRIAAIADDAEAAVGDDGLWPVHPLDEHPEHPLRAGLYLGAAGLVWALHRLGRDRPDLIRELHARYLERPDWPGVVPGYLVGEAGILLVSHLLEPSEGTSAELARAIAANRDNETNELLWGSPGTMLAALAMHRATGDESWDKLWRSSADELWARWLPSDDGMILWTQQLYGRERVHLGAGHGFAGNALALLAGRKLLDPHRAAELDRRIVATATATAVREQGLANWPPLAGGELEPGQGGIRVQWCHGSPGMVTSLATAAVDDAEFTELLVEGGELVWRAGPLAKGPGLCHGTAGNGLAFLSLFKRTADEHWLERARRFAVHALLQVERHRERYGAGRHSLWTGDVGVAVMAQSCIDVRAGMPSLDLV